MNNKKGLMSSPPALKKTAKSIDMIQTVGSVVKNEIGGLEIPKIQSVETVKLKSAQKPILKNSLTSHTRSLLESHIDDEDTSATQKIDHFTIAPFARSRSKAQQQPTSSSISKPTQETSRIAHHKATTSDKEHQRTLSACRKVTFMIDDEIMPAILTTTNSVDDRGSCNIERSQVSSEDQADTQDIMLDELRKIDEMYSFIEREIEKLAVHENKQVNEIDALLESFGTNCDKDLSLDLIGVATDKKVDEEEAEGDKK